MIHRYLENDMPEDARRLAKEYGQYPWSGERGIKQNARRNKGSSGDYR